MRRRGAFLLAALVVWVTGAALGAPSMPRALAVPVFQLGKAHPAEHLPSLAGSKPVFILALGSDARPGEPVARLRSDSIHLIGVNPKSHRASVLGIPRDSYVDIPGHGTDKITSAMTIGGPALTVRTVENLTGIQIDYFLLTSFQGLTAMVDAIGGITVNVPFPMHDSFSGSDFEPGVQRLNGSQALAFARDRHSAPRGDFDRSLNQGRLILAACKQFRQEFTKDPGRLLVWMGAGMRNAQTDLSIDQVLDFFFFVSTIEPGAVKNVVLPGSAGTAGDKSVVFIGAGAQELYRDMEADGVLS